MSTISEIGRQILLGVVGLSSGLAIASGVFAFLSMVGIIPRLMGRTKTAGHARLYENMVVLGGTLGNIIYLFSDQLQAVFLKGGQLTIMGNGSFGSVLGSLLLGLYGIGAGIFVGCLAMALAEGLKVIPIMLGRIHLEKGLPFVVLAIALGKMCGSFFQYS